MTKQRELGEIYESNKNLEEAVRLEWDVHDADVL